MKKKRVYPWLTLGVAVVLISGCAGGQSPSDTASPSGEDGNLDDLAPVTLTVAELSPEASANGNALKEFADFVTEETDGKITFEFYWAGALVPGGEILGAVADGLADMGPVYASLYPADLPTINWFNQVGSMASDDFPIDLLQGMGAAAEMFSSTEILRGEIEALGVRPMFIGSAGTGEMVCVDPINSLSEAEGVLTRTPGASTSGEIEALGMSPVSLPSADIYEGLQRGVIDCAVVAGGSTYFPVTGVYEVAKNFYPIGMSANPGSGYVMNQDTWDSLPPAAQEIIAAGEARLAANLTREYAELSQAGVAEFENLGVTMVEVPEMRAAVQEYQDSVGDRMLASLPAGLTEADAEDLIETYRGLLEKWQAFLVDDMGLPEDVHGNADELTEAYIEGPDAVDWEAYAAKLQTALAK